MQYCKGVEFLRDIDWPVQMSPVFFLQVGTPFTYLDIRPKIGLQACALVQTNLDD